MIKLYHGDFLEKAKNIPDDSVDLVLTDPPYGTVKGLRLERQKDNVYGWDDMINPKVLFGEINRILRKNGKAVLFGQEPFTSRMVTEAIPNLPFSYRMVWVKDHFANGLGSKKAPVNYYEDVMVFSKHPESVANDDNPVKEYANQVFDYIGVSVNELKEKYKKDYFTHFRTAGKQFRLCTEEAYNKLIEDFDLNKMVNFVDYEELKEIDTDYKNTFASTFNIWEKEPVKDFEDVLVFNKTETNIEHPAKEYTNKIREFIGKTNKEIFSDFEKAGYNKYALLDTFNSDEARRYNFPTETTYNALIKLYNINKMDNFVPYRKISKVHDEYKKQVASTFNLWQKKKTKSNILKYAKDYPSLHPTQKPVLLLEDLVKTFSNEGDLVVDLTMGSGSTGVACKNTGRKFIGIEMDDEYFKVAKERIETHEQQLELI